MVWRPWMLAPLAALCLHAPLIASAQTPDPSWEPARTVPDWYVRGVAAALLDPTPGVLAETMSLLPHLREALGAIAKSNVLEEERRYIIGKLMEKLHEGDEPHRSSAAFILVKTDLIDSDQRTDVIETLVKLAASNNSRVQENVATTLGAIDPSDPVQRKTIIKTLVRLAASDDSLVQLSAARALGAITPDDPEQSRTVVDALIGLAGIDDSDIQESTAAALRAVALGHPEQLKTSIEILVKLSSSRFLGVQRAATEALGAINPNDPELHKTIVKALVKVLAADDMYPQGGAAAALGAVAPSDPEERKAIADILVNHVARGNWWTAYSDAPALDEIVISDPEVSKHIVETLVAQAASANRRVQSSAAIALGLIAPSESRQQGLVIQALLKLAASEDSIPVRDAVVSLGVVAPSDPEQRKIVIETLIKLTRPLTDPNDPLWDVQQSAVSALGKIAKRDSEPRKMIVETLVKLAAGGDRESEIGASAVDALSAINPTDPAQRKTVIETLVRLAASDREISASAARALGAINPPDAGQRETIVQALVKLATGYSAKSQASAAVALGIFAPVDPEMRKTVVDTLIRLAGSGEIDVAKSAVAALLPNGPLGVDQVAQLLLRINRDRVEETPKWRAIGWAFNGALPLSNEGATLMTFAGHPSSVLPERRPRDPRAAKPILDVFAKFWPEMQLSKTLQEEIAQQAVAITRTACPEVAKSSSAGVLEEGFQRLAQEWDRTVGWLRGLFGGQNAFRCWQGDDIATLTRLRDDFGEVDGLGTYQRELNDQITTYRATPVVGQFVITTIGWALLWTAFVAVFPYSSRIRAAYLYNEKARGWLSLGFLPAAMTLLPFLRRRMLLPFRDELLADAHLTLLKDADFYPGLRVRDRDGNVMPIAEAIPDIRGKLLLIGESGLGKSTFLRVLVSRSRRTTAYLNARACHGGVEAAIMQRVSGFESQDFFSGLIYSGDLAVIIDGLNEVNADVRAGIMAFANSAGAANLIMATQPIEGIGGDRSPLGGATAFELLPLARADIGKFLKSRPARDNPASVVKGEDYDHAVDRLLTNALDNAPATEAERETEAVLQEARAAVLILSNPMDLTYGSELIAMGQTPQPSQLILQSFRLACVRYCAIYDRDFPALEFARNAVAMRREDRNWLKTDEFPNEQGVLAEFRLIVPRAMSETSEKQITVMRFRHDKVMDVLTKRAFEVDEKLQVELVDDPRFRGVYLLFAQSADRELALRIRDRLVSHAAKTRDHGLSDEFVRLFDRGQAEMAESNALERSDQT